MRIAVFGRAVSREPLICQADAVEEWSAEDRPARPSRLEEETLKLLILDTCGVHASFALVDTSDRTEAMTVLEGRSASERLLPELRSALSGYGWALPDLYAVAVVAGPGSFTGARIGLAAAKGLCEAAELPLVLVSRLAVLTQKAAAETNEIVHALLSAGRDEFFYRRSAPHGAPIEALLRRDAVLDATLAGVTVACEPEVQKALPERDIRMVSPLLALDALPLVLARIAERSFDDVATSDANYVRRTEAEILERLRSRAETA